MNTFLPFTGSPDTPVRDKVTAPYSSATTSDGASSANEAPEKKIINEIKNKN